ncbi:MAG: serine/threonine-protein kinase [Methylococcaceae bacterium]|nr:serine/threonine-protein kinase [Methylococcaceae bacterium]
MAIHLTAGSRLKGYTLTTDMTSSDAGMSMWAFAEKDGFDYFVKCYLSPVFPDPEGPGSEISKARKRARCQTFETRMLRVESTLKECGNANFLVRGIDFFRQDGTYFKITKKVYANQSSVSALPARKQMLVLLSAAYSLKVLHETSSFIHADIKPENFLLQRAGAGMIAHLIDFDAGFYMGHPPLPDELVGDQRYWAPEMVAWLTHDHRARRNRCPALLQSLDVFSLGLTFCEYLSGALPISPSGHAYPGEAVLDNVRPTLPQPLQTSLAPLMTLIQAMLHKNPLSRPSAACVHQQLRIFNRVHFVSDTTYHKITASWKRFLVSGGESLRGLVKARAAHPAVKTTSELRVRGLKAVQRAGAPSFPGRLRFWSKA